MPASNPAASAPRAAAVRRFGRWQLLRLLGKSERTMAWQVADAQAGRELMLVLPRLQPADAAALQVWQQAVRQAARLNHPQLAPVAESGVQDGWPFVAYDMRDSATLADRAVAAGTPGLEAAASATQVLRGLAFAHEAGVAHHDLQPFLILADDAGGLRLAGLAAAAETAWRHDESVGRGVGGGAARQLDATDPRALRLQRSAAERDVLAVGVLLHGLLAGAASLGDADIGRVITRLPPYCGGAAREPVRLPWTTAHPVAEPLRAIVNRATDRQERQRYRNARTLLRALEGWARTETDSAGGALALLADRLRSVGVLPSSPGAAARAARLTLMVERERTNELAEVVLEDPALSFELLRQVNTAQVRGAQVAGSGPVLTVRRAIAMLGLDGVRRAALALRDWPGPLNEAGAAELQRLIGHCKRAAAVALELRPAGYDAEVVYLVTLLQNLGRLVVYYHFADEAQQIRRLMQPAPAPKEGDPEEPGMSEEGASFAVLGADTEAIGAAVARHWGLSDSVLALIRRQPATAPVRAGDDDEMLRNVASCANEAVDALLLPQPRTNAALQRVLQRWGRVLDIGPRDLQAALQASVAAGRASVLGAVSAAAEAPKSNVPQTANTAEQRAGI